MLTHILRDDAIRSWPLRIGIVASVAISFYWPTESPAEFWKLCWPTPAVFLFAAHVMGQRARVLELGLPLSARRLWLAHSLALGLGALAFLALSISVGVLVGPIDGVPLAAARLYDVALRLGAGLVIAVVVLQSRKPALARLTPSPAELLFPAPVLFGVPLVLFLDAGWVIALLGLALGVGVHTWRSLPATLTLVPPAAAEPAVVGAVTHRTLGERGHSRPRGWQAADPRRYAVSGTGVVVFLGFLFFSGFRLSAPMEVDTSSADGRFLWGLLVLCFSTLWANPTLQQLAVLDPLPVSRRVLFASMTLRPMAAVALGFGIGAVFEGSLDAGSAIFVLLLAALWLGLVAFFLGPLHALSDRLPGVWLTAAVVCLGVATQKGWIGAGIGLNALPEIVEALVRRSAVALPGGTAGLVLLAVLLLGGAYALAEVRFRRFEVPPQHGEAESRGGV